MPVCNIATDDHYLDAARAGILAVGVTRTTLTDVARRAEVSRMTLYRRWPDMRALLADLMTREWLDVAATILTDDTGEPRSPERIAASVVNIIKALRQNPLFHKIVDVDPDVLLPYLLKRRGRTQDALLTLVEGGLLEGQRSGRIREGSPTLLARGVLLAAHGHALSAHTMVDDVSAAQLDDEFALMVRKYLEP